MSPSTPLPASATEAQKPATVGPQKLQAKSLGPTAGVNHSLEACSEHPISVRFSLFPYSGLAYGWETGRGHRALGSRFGRGSKGIPVPTPRNEK